MVLSSKVIFRRKKFFGIVSGVERFAGYGEICNKLIGNG